MNFLRRRSHAAALELVLAVGLDGNVRSCVCDARQAVALAGLVIIQEGLVALVDAALQDLPSAARAGAGAAGVRQLQALLLSLIQDVDVLRALEGLSSIRGLQGDLEVRGHAGPGWHGVDDGRHVAEGQGTTRQRLAAHVDALLRRHEGLLAGRPEAAEQGCAAGGGHEHRKRATLGSHGVLKLTTSKCCAARSLS